MKITFISTMGGFPWGGSEELWYRVVKEALIKKHQVQVCVKDWKEEPEKIKDLRNKGAIIIKRKDTKTNLFTRAINKLKLNPTNTKYTKAIMHFAPDCLLISQATSLDFFWSTILFELTQKIKKPYFLISQFNFENSHILNESQYIRIKELKYRWTKFYFVSKRNLFTAERQAALKFENAFIIDNPINISSIEKQRWPTNPVLQMACVARYDCRFKGQDLLFEALSDPIFKNVNYSLNLFGTGPDEEYLKRLIVFFQLADKVKIKGHAENIDEIWKHHHILILPSIAEGTPLALQECMLKGRTALVTDVGDCGKLIIDGVNGFLCSSASVSIIKKKLLQLFQISTQDLKILAENAFTTAQSTIDVYSYHKILQDIEKVV